MIAPRLPTRKDIGHADLSSHTGNPHLAQEFAITMHQHLPARLAPRSSPMFRTTKSYLGSTTRTLPLDRQATPPARRLRPRRGVLVLPIIAAGRNYFVFGDERGLLLSVVSKLVITPLTCSGVRPTSRHFSSCCWASSRSPVVLSNLAVESVFCLSNSPGLGSIQIALGGSLKSATVF